MTSTPGDITVLLQRARDPRDRQARQELYARVEEELRARAAARLRHCPHSSLQTTELIDEAFMRLVNARSIAWEGRGEFFRVAGGVMRRILCDQVRSNLRRQRLTPLASEDLPDSRCAAPEERLEREEVLLRLLEALGKLEEEDAEAAEVFELRYFGGRCLVLEAMSGELHLPDAMGHLLPFREVATILSIPRSTAFAHWSRAVDRLQVELHPFAPPSFPEANHGH
jgi:RNA polymerase sigma factor (TIGR02999 family)